MFSSLLANFKVSSTRGKLAACSIVLLSKCFLPCLLTSKFPLQKKLASLNFYVAFFAGLVHFFLCVIETIAIFFLLISCCRVGEKTEQTDQLLADIDNMLADLNTHLDFMIPESGPKSSIV